MIKDMVKPFKEALAEDKNIVLDNYRLKDGLYIKLDVNRPIEICEENYIIVNNKEKDKGIDGTEIKKPGLHKWFKEMDYYSVILNEDTNKCIDLPAKKIQSTNQMTLFLKKDKFPMIGKEAIEKEKLLKLIEKYFDRLMLSENKFMEIYEKSKYTKGTLKNIQKEEFLKTYFKEQIEYIRTEERIKSVEENRRFIIENFNGIIESIKEFAESHTFNGYIKIFLDYKKEMYEMESQVYTIPRIFNVNDYNLFIDGEILGLPSNNITINTKKPYLLLKTMQTNAPYRVKVGEVQNTKKFFEWLVVQGKFKEIKLDYNCKFNGTDPHKNGESYLAIHLNQKSEIDEFDNIPFSGAKLNFVLYNVLNIEERIDKKDKNSLKLPIKNEPIKEYEMLQQRFSEYFFNNKLFGYFKDTDPDIKSNEFTGQMRALFMLGRDGLFDFFSRGVDTSIKANIDRLTMDLIQEKFKKTVQGFNFDRISKAYNLRISLLNYFELGGEKMADKIKNTMDSLKLKLVSDKLAVCESDEEFYFAAGQLAYYILSQSESDRKNFGIFEPILNAKDSSQLKNKLKDIFAVYKHAIRCNNIKFKNAMSMVMGYEADRKIADSMQDMLLAGLLANNIFYEKKEA
ncbi:hypothetical protein [Clostridium estertheticum]|uniref:hypothetical protein n=1 Tax=Clostridium estertheticum TaxID=238834 RepID=UPI001C7D8BE3|nr:hypothetical protein [Clostridium estertheticum]MBX4264467.1 hypothetical protein [Clostridium estertheticum]WLC89306.1 hypothetical protein KTC95_03520 [Clostridium estertheticum]